VLQSPADDDPRPHEQILREVSCEDSEQSEGESLDSTNAFSSKRKPVEAEDDPIAATLQQLREELKQLRQEVRV
jgi:TolA-binding protein